MERGWKDDGLRYGLVTRTLHWSMALLICWQFSGLVISKLFGRVAVSTFINGMHFSTGVAILVLAIVRAVWGFYNLQNRPEHEKGALGLVARAGHLLLYVLMIVVPALALLRAFGNGRSLTLFGIQWLEGGGDRVLWMTMPASLLHNALAWTLLAMIGGHIAMAIVHRYVWKDDVVKRMAGRP